MFFITSAKISSWNLSEFWGGYHREGPTPGCHTQDTWQFIKYNGLCLKLVILSVNPLKFHIQPSIFKTQSGDDLLLMCRKGNSGKASEFAFCLLHQYSEEILFVVLHPKENHRVCVWPGNRHFSECSSLCHTQSSNQQLLQMSGSDGLSMTHETGPCFICLHFCFICFYMQLCVFLMLFYWFLDVFLFQ